jgi:hypothetical protein
MLPIRLVPLLSLVLALSPAAVTAQNGGVGAADGVDITLVGRLCAAAAADEAQQAACISAVAKVVTEMTAAEMSDGTRPLKDPDLPDKAQPLLEETQARIDEALAQLRELDLQAALDDVAGSTQELQLDVDIDLQGAIDDAVAALEALGLSGDIDLQAAIDDAVATALAGTEDIDLGALLDEVFAGALSGIEDVGVQAAIDDTLTALQQNVEDARAVVSEAQQWAQQNTDVVCRGGSVSLGTTVGVVVFALTGVEWLGLQAFWATERFTNRVCGEMVE